MPKGVYQRRSASERFWSKVNKNGPIHPVLGTRCWTWIGGKRDRGYGAFRYLDSQSAHRVSWILKFGQIPKSKLVCHHCDNPSCVNPDHLFVGTSLDNNQDMVKKGRGKYPGPINPASGDRNGLRLHPERAARGDRNGARLYPERLARGGRNISVIHPEYRQGERNGRSKLTDDDIVLIRQLYSPEFSQVKLAERFGVTQCLISRIVRRTAWKHIE